MAVYCVIADIQNRLSSAGVTLRTDDTPPTTYGDVIDDASATIDEYCLLLYTAANLALSRWVKHRCADIATGLLCERRGNGVPDGIARKWDRTIAALERVQAGILPVPDIAKRRTGVMVASNMNGRLAPEPHAVVVRSRQPARTTPTDYPQKVDPVDFSDLDR